MKIKSKDTYKLTTEEYVVEYEGTDYRYVDYLNEDGKIVDSELKTIDGYAVEVPHIFEAIQNFVDENPNF